MAIKIQHRRDTAANWASNNPVLSSWEIWFETDTQKFKIWNGVNTFADLDYQLESITDAEVKTAYENNANTNAFTDTEKTKLSWINEWAEANVWVEYTQTEKDNLANQSWTNTWDQDLSWLALKSDMIDEDDMVSNSDIKYPTQQSVKKYVDDNIWGWTSWGWTWLTLYDWAISWTQTTWTVFEVSMAWDATLSKFKISLETKPEWADFIVKIYKNWVETDSATILTTATATNWLYITTVTSTTAFIEDDRLTVKITQVWTDVAWADFVYQIS